ncbi:MAG: helix-turn-helix transcriptional regulator [Anaerolineaceae bacterium]|nr:helix-turn-helix transcriptional regulator [Anaerolineaceae bacterium]
MPGDLLQTKLYVPQLRPSLVPRPHLIAKLNQGLHRKLTLISAPAGFGKTTLVSEWIAGCKRPSAWISLDERDSDLTHFLAYFVAALQKIFPTFGEQLLGIFESAQLPPTESILTTLLNEIVALPEALVVLDDYHMVDAPQIDQALTFLLEHLPPQMHLVITTREDPNFPLARWRVRSQLTEFRANDLRFTVAETAEFLRQVMGLNLSENHVATLEARTEGWIAGLQLAALSMQGREDVSGFIGAFTGDNRYIVDYLVEEVLQHQPESARRFLLQTAILDRLNGPLCRAVTGQQEGKTQLEALERGNFFIIPLDDRRYWYRYHHLFAEVLRMHLTIEQPDLVSTLHQRASQWYEENGLASDAIYHALAAKDFSRAAGLAETTWQNMYESFQSPTWLEWVKDLPEELLCTRPVLCTQIAWGFMNAHEVDASESRLRDAERCLEGSSDGMIIVNKEQFRSLRARIAFARAYNAQTQRDFLAAIKYAELVFELISEEDQFLRAQTTAILGATYLINGDLDAACQAMNNWIDSSLKVGNYFAAFAYAMAEKADILTAQGNLREALWTYQQSLQFAAEHDSRVLRVMVHPYLGMSMLYHEMGDDKAADQHFQKSLELASLHKSVDWSYRRCIAQARLKESIGELDTALELLEEAKLFYIKTLMPHTRPVDAIKAKICLKQRRLFEAEKWVNEQYLSVDDELSYLHEFEHIILARVLLAEYQNNRNEYIILEALRLLERLLKAAEDGNRIGSVIEILVTQVLVYQAQGGSSRVFESLERALTLAQPKGYFRIFVDEGEPLQSLLLAFRRSIEKQPRGHNHELSGYVDKLLAAFAQPKDMQQSKLMEPLSQRELDILRLFKTDLSGPEIAQELVVALSTVRTHTKGIYSKLNVNSRRAAVKRAIELGLI